MKKIAAVLAAITMIAAVQTPAHAKSKNWHGHRGAAGLAIGLTVLGVVAAASRAAAERDRYENRCRSWRWQCREGSDRACWKYDERC